MTRKSVWLLFFAVLFGLSTWFLDAQTEPQPYERYLERIYAVPAVTGDEERMAAKIISLLEGNCVRDRIGSVFLTKGKGDSHLALAAGLDEFGFVVSGIRSDGFVHMDRIMSPPRQLYDFYQFGHPVRRMTVSVESPLPTELRASLDSLGPPDGN